MCWDDPSSFLVLLSFDWFLQHYSLSLSMNHKCMKQRRSSHVNRLWLGYRGNAGINSHGDAAFRFLEHKCLINCIFWPPPVRLVAYQTLTFDVNVSQKILKTHPNFFFFFFLFCYSDLSWPHMGTFYLPYCKNKLIKFWAYLIISIVRLQIDHLLSTMTNSRPPGAQMSGWISL